MREIHRDELREIQMQILDYIDSFCRNNGIKYTLSGGSLLGAIRHGGFIPWDDDIDIQMLRSEYDKFISLWEKNITEDISYQLISPLSDNSMGYPFSKIQDTRTVSYIGKFQRIGVCVDVFPVDNVIDEKDFQRRHSQIKRLYSFRSMIFLIMKRTPISLLKNIYNSIAKYIEKISKKYSEQSCKQVYEMVSGLRCNSPIPIVVFKSFKDIKFENRKYMSVEDYDTYLKLTFGDYMKLPPEKQRVPSHDNIFYMKDC